MSKIKIVVGSGNPIKLEAVAEAFALMFKDDEFEFVTHPAPSGVADQPFGVEETKLGAKNRAQTCRDSFPEADYCVGLEGGIEKSEDGFWVSGWMCVIDKVGKIGFGRTSAFVLPPKVTELVLEGKELSDATDIVFNEVKSGSHKGTVGILTADVIHRKDFYREALIHALIPFKNPDLY